MSTNLFSLCSSFADLFSLVSERGHADERRLGLLLYDCLRLPRLLGEVAAFGGTNIEPSVRSCLEMFQSPREGITVEQMVKWAGAEPQSLVWLAVLHRLRLAEKCQHSAKCNQCKTYPIDGFRYRCLKCFNFDLCQNCFLSNVNVGKHKQSHPIREYCVATSSGEDMKDFAKILKNKFKSGRYFKKHSELGYLPVQSLHEGDRYEDSIQSIYANGSPIYSGSQSYAPSSNTTPVHTIQYRAASPGALTQRDLDFMPESRFVNQSFSTISSTMAPAGYPHYYQHPQMMQVAQPMVPQPIYGNQIMMHPMGSSSMGYPTPLMSRSLNRDSPGPTAYQQSAIRSQRKASTDEVHNRVGQYASRLAEMELNRNAASRSSARYNQSNAPQPASSASLRKHSLSSASPSSSSLHAAGHSTLDGSFRAAGYNDSTNMNGNAKGLSQDDDHYDVVAQSPNDLLSKMAADQRSEMEQIIQRLEEENRQLTNQYNHLREDKPAPKINGTSNHRRQTSDAADDLADEQQLKEDNRQLKNMRSELSKVNQVLESQLNNMKKYQHVTSMDSSHASDNSNGQLNNKQPPPKSPRTPRAARRSSNKQHPQAVPSDEVPVDEGIIPNDDNPTPQRRRSSSSRKNSATNVKPTE